MCPSGRDPSRRNLAAAGAAPADFRSAFDVLDADRDGKISRDDLKAFYSGFASPALSEDDISSMISAADADRNGFVDLDEFQRVLCRRSAVGSVMEEAFRVMDRDGDGKVGFEDLKAYLGWAGMPTGDEEIRAMIRMGGGDAVDGVSFDALVKILAVDFASSENLN
ncbi:calcium-binding protein CP1-like [Phoenix dactylifera]|uniref:Calcium-binding protein CP1-like n=1 Tax=Phoenix dactylifera TaxID=42345 RepID=A0A8B7CXS4_PHODC|nr:calcium-binding protein CP1-like [Phoenix dactylifera]